MPAEGNALAQILLERGVNGESPIKQRPPRKSTTTRSTPKSVRSAKVATKTPRTASKRTRKSTVAPGVSVAEEPKTAKKNKRPSTSTSKTPKARSRKQTKGVDVDADDGGGASPTLGRKCVDLNNPFLLPALTLSHHLIYAHLSCDGTCIDVDAAPPLNSTTPSRPHPAMRPKSFEERLADARECIYAIQTYQKELNLCYAFEVNYASGHCSPPDPSRLAQNPSSQSGTRAEGTGKGKGKVASTRSAPSIKPPVVERRKAAQSSLPVETEAGLQGDDDDSSDHSDQPLVQKPAPAPKSRKKATTKRAAPKAKTDASRAVKTIGEAAAAASANSNSRKRGVEDPREIEETALPVALPRVYEDLPDVAPLPPTKRARVLQEKNAHAPRKRKEHAKDGDDGVTVNNEIEKGPPEKKRRRADPHVRYVPRQCCAAYHWNPHSSLRVSRRRPGKENENGTKSRKPASGASKKAMDKVRYHLVSIP